jgi:hypothetical protein
MTPRYCILISLIALFVAPATGCSLVLMDTVPDDYYPDREPDCDGYLSPPVDAIVAAGTIIAGAVMLAKGVTMTEETCYGDSGEGIWNDCRNTGEKKVYVGVGTIGSSAPFIFSAAIGFSRARKCSKAVDDHESWRVMTLKQQREFDEKWEKGRSQ